MTNIIAKPLDFPSIQPQGFLPLEGEPIFNAAKHLQIEMPDEVISLKEFGYSDEAIAECPTDFAITSTFRLLSDEGAAAMLEVARMLEAYTTSNARISRCVRGGVYRSKFLRDLCTSPELTQIISQICGTPLLPHTLPHQLGHLNYNPLEVGKNVDKWHVDTLRIDFVMFVTDPNLVEGGEFEYFHGTKEEVAALTSAGKPLPEEKIRAASLPGPGYAVLQQGNMVVHRAKGLRKAGERITMVNGYVPADITFPDYNRFDQLYHVDPKHVCASEYSRHVAWMGRENLDAQITHFAFSENREEMAENLENIAQLLTKAASELRGVEKTKIEHFGDG